MAAPSQPPACPLRFFCSSVLFWCSSFFCCFVFRLVVVSRAKGTDIWGGRAAPLCAAFPSFFCDSSLCCCFILCYRHCVLPSRPSGPFAWKKTKSSTSLLTFSTFDGSWNWSSFLYLAIEKVFPDLFLKKQSGVTLHSESLGIQESGRKKSRDRFFYCVGWNKNRV